MGRFLFDTSVYISLVRKRDPALFAIRNPDLESSIWLSAVVLEELYAGASAGNIHAIKQFQQDFENAGRILVPNLADWARAGHLLARVAEKYGYEQIGRGRLTNDALIATSAGRLGIEVLTGNERDFRRLAKFGAFTYQVISV